MKTKRTYQDANRGSRGRECEHCDGAHGTKTREDYLRGWICRACDEAMDTMDVEDILSPAQARSVVLDAGGF